MDYNNYRYNLILQFSNKMFTDFVDVVYNAPAQLIKEKLIAQRTNQIHVECDYRYCLTLADQEVQFVGGSLQHSRYSKDIDLQDEQKRIIQSLIDDIHSESAIIIKERDRLIKEKRQQQTRQAEQNEKELYQKLKQKYEHS